MTFSGTTERSDSVAVRLDLAGDLRGAAAAQLRLMLLEAIVVERPDVLIIDLDAVVCLSPAGLTALISGYVIAIDYGTSYCVVNAHDEVRHVMQTAGFLDMLADSDDTGALLLALLFGDSRT